MRAMDPMPQADPRHERPTCSRGCVKPISGVSNRKKTVRWNLLLGPRCMKILYIANDRRAAELAALPLRAVAPDVAISWAASLGEGLYWIDENRDVATLIVEVGSDDPGCESFVSRVRGLDVT